MIPLPVIEVVFKMNTLFDEIFSILDQEQHPGGGSTRQARDTIGDRISWRHPAREIVSYNEILFRLSILSYI